MPTSLAKPKPWSQFSLADALCWMTYLAATLAIWRGHPICTVILTAWGIPACLRYRTFCWHDMKRFDLFERSRLLLGCVGIEAANSLAALVCSLVSLGVSAVVVGTIVALVTPFSFEVVFVLLGVLHMPLCIAIYEYLRRATWPRADDSPAIVIAIPDDSVSPS